MKQSQSGQTLIETIVAIFVLTMALSTALGLAIYAKSNSATAQSQIIASNLAREGIDVVRYMRDTNWLEGEKAAGSYALDTDCGTAPPNSQSAGAEAPMLGKPCYPNWLVGPPSSPYHGYNISASNNAGDYRAVFSPGTNSWTLDRANGNQQFHMCLQADGTYQHNAACDSNTAPLYARRISITTKSTSSPYTPLNPELAVQSVVIWGGKNCPNIFNQDPVSFATPCKIVVEEDLTNWKDY